MIFNNNEINNFKLVLYMLNVKIIMAEALMLLFKGNLEKFQAQISNWD